MQADSPINVFPGHLCQQLLPLPLLGLKGDYKETHMAVAQNDMLKWPSWQKEPKTKTQRLALAPEF